MFPRFDRRRRCFLAELELPDFTRDFTRIFPCFLRSRYAIPRLEEVRQDNVQLRRDDPDVRVAGSVDADLATVPALRRVRRGLVQDDQSVALPHPGRQVHLAVSVQPDHRRVGVVEDPLDQRALAVAVLALTSHLLLLL